MIAGICNYKRLLHHGENSCIIWMFVVLNLSISIVSSFNLDAKFPQFFASPTRLQNTYFGYAVDYFVNSNEMWVVVGAPKSGPDGEVYRCSVTDASSFGNCELVRLDLRESSNVKQMFGSTLQVGSNKQLLSCAPKFSISSTQTKDDGTKLKSYNPVGACYLIDDFTEDFSTRYDYVPCLNRLGSSNGHLLSFCQAGFSATFWKENTRLLLGAVGSYYNQGSIIILNRTNSDHFDPTVITTEITPTIPDNWTGNSVEYYKQSYDNNYMGYSVAIGRAANDMSLLATSAPRRLGFDLLGSVIIYDENLRNELVSFTGEQIGEYFGHGLAFVDLNGDDLDDLIAGSPLYTDTTYRLPEAGRIYVYYQQVPSGSQTIKFSDPIIINGNASMGRFGNTITSLDDVNGDGYQDFLVSAPYEGSSTSSDKFGALYVFNGGSKGISVNPSQVIHGANLEGLTDPKTNVRSLGYSIKGGKDIDRNGYPDIVAGAYLSGQAVVIRARPVVKLKVQNSIHPNEIDLETLDCELKSGAKAVCFTVDSCFSYDGKSLPATIEFYYTYDIDSTEKEDDKRAFIADTSQREMMLTAGENSKCVDEVVYLKKEVRDKLKPISVTLSYWLKEKNEPVEPVLDIFTGVSSTVVAEMSKNCGSDDICTPELTVESTINPNRVIVGAYTEIVISSTVSNSKEYAYQTLLVVQYPRSVSYINVVEEGGTPRHCIDVNNTVVCEVANPLKQDSVKVDLRFGVLDEQGDVSQLMFEIFANCSNEKSYSSESVMKYIEVGVEATIDIFNASLPEIVALDKLSDQVVNVTGSYDVSHTYEITNVGPSSLESAQIQLLWPLRLESGELLFGLDEVITYGPVTCSAAHVLNQTKLLSADSPSSQSKYDSDESYHGLNYYNCKSTSDYCSEITCEVDSMRPKDDILITFKGKLRVGPLLVSEIDSIITSSLVFEILSYPYKISASMEGTLTSSQVSTSALFPQSSPPASVDWWVIAIAIAGGVIFLLIIILILWKCGFFKRRTLPTEQELEEQEQLHQAQLIEKQQPLD